MKKFIDADILRAYMKTFLTGNDLYNQNGIDSFVDSIPAADVVERPKEADYLLEMLNCKRLDEEQGHILADKILCNLLEELGYRKLERRGITVLAVANHKQTTVDLLEKLPSAERHGRWLDVEPAPHNLFYATCSVCGVRQTLEVKNYCPNCGASMMDDNAIQHTECVENALDALDEVEE